MRTLWRLWLGLSGFWALLILAWMKLMPDDVRASFQEIAPILILGPIGLSGGLLLVVTVAFARR